MALPRSALNIIFRRSRRSANAPAGRPSRRSGQCPEGADDAHRDARAGQGKDEDGQGRERDGIADRRQPLADEDDLEVAVPRQRYLVGRRPHVGDRGTVDGPPRRSSVSRTSSVSAGSITRRS